MLRTSQEAYDFLTALRKLVRYLEICDGNMEEGSLRCDANVSVQRVGDTLMGRRVEVKNMNSIRNVQLAIEYEINRQVELCQHGKQIVMETRAYDASSGTTISMRSKETLNDYRYFPEPDLPPVVITKDLIAQVQDAMPLLPRDYLKKFTVEYQLSVYDATILTETKAMALFFEAICGAYREIPYGDRGKGKPPRSIPYKAVANWLIGPVKSYLNVSAIPMQAFPLSPQSMAALVDLVESGKMSFSVASQKLYPALLQQPDTHPSTLASQLHLLQDSDEDAVQKLVEEVIKVYPGKVVAYQNGKKGILGMLMGEVMRKSQGRASPQVARKLLERSLEGV